MKIKKRTSTFEGEFQAGRYLEFTESFLPRLKPGPASAASLSEKLSSEIPVRREIR